MTQINWGLAQGPNSFDNALARGFELGNVIRQRKDESDRKNALSAYAKNPGEETFGGLADAAPDIAIPERQRMQAAQQERLTAELTQRAMGGDQEALGQLATVSFDRWRALDQQSKEGIKQKASIFGNAALDYLSETDPARKAFKLQGVITNLGPHYPEVAQLAQMTPEQVEAAMRSAAYEAQLADKLIAMERPDYMAVPNDATLVNARDPASLAAFGQMAPPQPGGPAPQGTGGNDAITMEIYRGAVNGLGAQGAAAWLQRNGLPVAVTSPNEARQLPSGTRIILPDGSEGRVP
jgi:hypothetical protein